MAGIPAVVRIEMAFASYPDATEQVWTDVSDFVRLADGVRMTRGRPDEFAGVEPGTLALMLDNTDGRFTWGNTGSPYSPGVLPQRRVRVVLEVPDFDEPPAVVTSSWPGVGVFPAVSLYPSTA